MILQLRGLNVSIYFDFIKQEVEMLPLLSILQCVKILAAEIHRIGHVIGVLMITSYCATMVPGRPLMIGKDVITEKYLEMQLLQQVRMNPLVVKNNTNLAPIITSEFSPPLTLRDLPWQSGLVRMSGIPLNYSNKAGIEFLSQCQICFILSWYDLS